MGSRILASYMKRFSDKYPDVQFELYNEMADHIKDKIDKGILDIGLVLEPIDTSKYEFIRFSGKETWGILCRKDHPLANKERIAAVSYTHLDVYKRQIRQMLMVTGKLPIKTEELEGIDLEELTSSILECIDNETLGNIIEVSSSDGTTVRIFIG